MNNDPCFLDFFTMRWEEGLVTGPRPPPAITSQRTLGKTTPKPLSVFHAEEPGIGGATDTSVRAEPGPLPVRWKEAKSREGWEGVEGRLWGCRVLFTGSECTVNPCALVTVRGRVCGCVRRGSVPLL